MATKCYYFTGTGNSLKIAGLIHDKLKKAELIPIVGALNSPERKISTDKVGIIFPVHSFSLPIPVEQFLKEFDFSNTDYIFAVATRGGSPCSVFKKIGKYLRKKGKKLNAAFYIDMPNNWLLIWDRPDDNSMQKLFSQAYEQAAEIAGIVKAGKNHLDYKHGFFILEHVLFPLLSIISKWTRYFWLDTAFYADHRCTNCGICKKVCPVEKIEMSGKKPRWNKEVKCTFCFACIHYCPEHAIQFSATQSKKRGRYHHPDITPDEISKQKQIPGIACEERK